jgi:excisionase family DNA binding protein
MHESAVAERTAYSVQEIAERAGVAESRLYKLIEAGEIPAFQLARQWRVRAEDAAAAVERLLAVDLAGPFLSVREVAAQWGISERTVWRLVSSGELPSELKGGERRIAPEDAQAYIDGLLEKQQAARSAA